MGAVHLAACVQPHKRSITGRGGREHLVFQGLCKGHVIRRRPARHSSLPCDGASPIPVVWPVTQLVATTVMNVTYQAPRKQPHAACECGLSYHLPATNCEQTKRQAKTDKPAIHTHPHPALPCAMAQNLPPVQAPSLAFGRNTSIGSRITSIAARINVLHLAPRIVRSKRRTRSNEGRPSLTHPRTP